MNGFLRRVLYGESPSTLDAKEPPSATEPEAQEATGEAESRPGLASSALTTMGLLIVLVVVGLATLAGGVYLWLADDAEVGDGPSATDELPVRISVADAQGAAAAAAEAVETIVSSSWKDYDAQLVEAQQLMTPEYAHEEFLPEAEKAQNDVVRSKTEVQVEVKGIGVRRADTDRVETLIFLDQLTTRDGKDPVLSPFRVLVTMDRTDQGWLISGLDTT